MPAVLGILKDRGEERLITIAVVAKLPRTSPLIPQLPASPLRPATRSPRWR
jgi:hypothetical protein